MKKVLQKLAVVFLASMIALLATGIGFVLPVLGITELGMTRQTIAIIAMVIVILLFVAGVVLEGDEAL